MQLIGMLDSPYVRRVAVSLQLLAACEQGVQFGYERSEGLCRAAPSNPA